MCTRSSVFKYMLHINTQSSKTTSGLIETFFLLKMIELYTFSTECGKYFFFFVNVNSDSFELIVSEMTNQLYFTNANCRPNIMSELGFGGRFYLAALVLISSTNRCMPTHAHALCGMLQSRDFPQRSISRSVQRTLSLLLLDSVSCLHSTFLVPAPIHTLDFARAHAYTQAPAFSFTRLPHTHTHTHRLLQGLQMCVLICFQHRLFSCQCADSEFSTLSYEIRVGDIRAIQ